VTNPISHSDDGGSDFRWELAIPWSDLGQSIPTSLHTIAMAAGVTNDYYPGNADAGAVNGEVFEYVPEPSACLLMWMGLSSVVVFRRRRVL